MMGGILGKALSGAGAGAYEAGVMSYRDQILKARDERLAELQAQRDERQYAQQDALQKSSQDFQASQTDKQIAAQKDMENTRYGHDLTARGMTINAESSNLDKRLASEEKRHRESIGMQAATNSRLDRQLSLQEQEFDIKKQVAQIELDNAKRVKELRAEFGTASPDRQAQIRDEVSLLTGKDKENFLPVPLKDETGNVTGYQIFDKTRGKFVDSAGAAKPQQPANPNRPPLSSFFKKSPEKTDW